MNNKQKRVPTWRYHGVRIWWYTNLRKTKVRPECFDLTSYDPETETSWIKADKGKVLEAMKDFLYGLDHVQRNWPLLCRVELLNVQEFLNANVVNPYKFEEGEGF